MLVIEIMTCPDPEFEGVWRFHQNQIYLGYPEGDIAPAVDGLPSFAYMIEVLPHMIQGTPHPEVDHWLLNGKRATRPRRLRLGDTIVVMGIKMKVVEAALEEFTSRKTILDSRLQELIAANSPILPVIKLLKEKTK